MTQAREDSLRIDKWLWYARFCKSRSLASRLCASGKLRLNRQVVRKAHQTLRVGDVLTFPMGPHIRVIEVKALAGRRGPAVEARTLYQDLAPPEAQPRPPRAPARPPGTGRPTKADRRALDRLRGTDEG
ncbi:MAG: RNA-binding S4 domain-containing protein [Alphaproteobacteria bacterium]|nr:RNA-binding S4 domain-containing protein [Alphaproteobacteria bacterium]